MSLIVVYAFQSAKRKLEAALVSTDILDKSCDFRRGYATSPREVLRGCEDEVGDTVYVPY
jgi:hypothetical protein